MAFARLGPTSRRPSIGFQPVGSPRIPQPPGGGGGFRPIAPGGGGFQPQLPSAGGFSPRGGQVIADWQGSGLHDVVQEKTRHWYDPPLSVLGGIARVLGVGENAAVGMIQSLQKDIHHVASDPLSPWAWLDATWGGDNFVEVARAVKENRTYTEWLREANDPGSFLYRNAFVLGLGLSILGDPTTYISFGATGASKIAAQKLWMAAAESTADEALTAMKVGKIARTGEDVSEYGNSYERVFQRIHTAAERPFSNGDALESLRKWDRGKMVDLDPKYIEAHGVKTAKSVRRVLPRGGQGIRFAGVELPGTRGLGGRAVGAIESAAKMEPGEMRQGALRSLGFLIPQDKILRIQDDLTRAIAMSEYTRATRTMAFERFGAFSNAAEMFILDEQKFNNLRKVPGLARARVAVDNLFNKTPSAVPSAARKGLFREGFKAEGMYKLHLEDIRAKGLSTRDEMLDFARLQGVEDRAIKDLQKEWDRLARVHDDPLEVMGRWQAKVVGRVTGANLVRQIVRNPLLARPHLVDVHDMDNALAQITEEQANVSRRLIETSEKIAKTAPDEKRRLSQLKRIQNDLKQRSQLLAGDFNKISGERAGVPLGPGVKTEEEFRTIFHEDGVPFSFEGQKYLVPAPVEWALRDIRNPQFVDKELNRFLKLINIPQNKWKIAATSMNPSFWWMNAIGGMWNNLLGPVYNPGDYVAQLADRVRLSLDEMDDEKFARGLLAHGRQVMLRNPKQIAKLERAKVRRQAFEERQVGAGQVGFEIHPEIQEVKRKAKVPTKKRQALTAARRGYMMTAGGVTLAPDDWVPDELEDATVLGMPVFSGVGAVVAGLPEASRFGRHMTQEVETMLRETPMRAAMKDPTYHQMLDAWSVAPPVHFGRWMGQTDVGADVAAREAIWDIGAAMAIRYQFDYTNLKSWERNFAKTVFPFYVFNKNNFVLQVQELVNRPRFVATANDVANFSNYTTATEENEGFQELLPEYFSKLGMFRIPVPGAIRSALGLPEGEDVYLNPKLPYSSLNLFPPLWQLTQDKTVTPSNHKLLGVMSSILGMAGPAAPLPFPGMKPLLEYSVGYNLGLARPIDYQQLQSGGWRNSPREAPGWMKAVPKPLRDWMGVFKDPQTGALMMDANKRYIADQVATPFMNSAGDVFNWNTAGAEADRIKANNFAFITGIRLTPVDPLRLSRGWLYRMENALESAKANAKARGERFPGEDELFLRQLRAQIRVTEFAWDQQEKALKLDGR